MDSKAATTRVSDCFYFQPLSAIRNLSGFSSSAERALIERALLRTGSFGYLRLRQP